MANFTINEAQYGRSRPGIQQAKTSVNKYISSIKGIIEQWNTIVERQVRNSWSGDSAEAFIKLVKSKSDNLVKYLDSRVLNAFNDPSGILEEDFNEYVKDQKKISF